MALTKTTLTSRFGDKFAKQTVANATATGFEASSATLYTCEIDNTNNTTVAHYVKFYDVALGSTTVGTTGPEAVLFVPANKKVTYQFTQGISFSTALVMACVTTGGTAGTSNPSNAVIVKVTYS